jgi:hypothetical protein
MDAPELLHALAKSLPERTIVTPRHHRDEAQTCLELARLMD